MDSLLTRVREGHGCRVMLSTEVADIEVRDGVARSVTTASGDRFSADTILFDADAQLSLDLIGREHFPASFRRKLSYDYGPSVVSVYLGIEGYDLRAHGFGEQNVFWYPDVDVNAVYDRQLGDEIPERPFFFCNAPSLRPHDDVLTPPGGEQLVMVAPCSYRLFRRLRDRDEREYTAAKAEFASRIIRVVEEELAPGVSKHIRTKVIGSPLTNEFYVRAPMGNCYSTPLDPKHVNLRRVNYRSPFPNLHYVGASASLPGFATLIHFASMLYEELTGDSVY
jgi:phytoene dehydrogenase-like protein